jgi:hypothetical protein
MMAQVARAHTEAAGGPDNLKSLGVQFRGMGAIGEEIVVSGTVSGRDGDTVTVDSRAEQGGRTLIKGARATLYSPASPA